MQLRYLRGILVAYGVFNCPGYWPINEIYTEKRQGRINLRFQDKSSEISDITENLIAVTRFFTIISTVSRVSPYAHIGILGTQLIDLPTSSVNLENLRYQASPEGRPNVRESAAVVYQIAPIIYVDSGR